MVLDFIKTNKYYLLLMGVLFIVFLILGINYYEQIITIDEAVSNFVSNHIVNQNATKVLKVLTNMGGVVFFVIVLLIVLVITYKKGFFSVMSINLLFTYLFSVVFKNIFRRERPAISLIKQPNDFSFPSGHTMCSVAFYGFAIYLVSKYVKNKFLKWSANILLTLILLVVAFSRIYLNVHYLSDVICGFILGSICLLMFIRYVKIKDII